MTADELKTLTTSTLDALGAALDAGHSDTLAAFFRAMARFHRYSFHNICLIVAQRRSGGGPSPAPRGNRHAGIALTYADALDGALGQSRGGAIDVLRNLPPAAEFVVLAHEYAHELLHHGEDRPASRDTRELEAEAVACVVGEAVGVRSVNAARDYIHLYRGDRDALSASFERIQRAASTILTAMEAESSLAA